MAGIFDLIQQLQGHPDPMTQIAALSQQGPPPAGPPPSAGPPAPPPAAGPAAAPPGPPGGPAGPSGAPGPQQPPAGPQVYQSPPDMAQANAKLAQGPQQQPQQQPDLMSLYAQLYQRQQASEMFNRGLGGLTAAFSPLSQRASLEHEWDNMGGDPNALMNSVMGIQNFQRQQAQYQALQRAAPDIAKQLGMTPDEVTAAGPQALQTAMQMNMPTEATRNYLQARNMMRQQGMSDDQINQIMPPETMALAGISDPNYRQYILERGRAMQAAPAAPAAVVGGGAPRPSPTATSAPIGPSAPGAVGAAAPGPGPAPVTAPPLAPPGSGLAKPATAAGAAPNAGTDDYPTWLAKKNAQIASIGEIAKERTQAKIALPGNDEQLDKIDTAIESIKTDPNLPHVLGAILPTTGLASTMAGRSPQDQQLAQRIDTLNKQIFSEGFKTGGGSRKTQQELNSLQGALGQGIQATYLKPEQYIQNLTRLQDQTRTARATGYGEAGDFSTMPANLVGYVNPAYRKGGMMEVANAPTPTPLTTTELQKAAPLLANPQTREAFLSHLRANGKDISGL